MTNEDIVGQILAACPGIAREQVLERLDREKRRTGGFISDETLLKVIAAEFGCEIPNGEATMPTLSLADLIPSLNNVSAVGRVVAVFAPKTFSGNRSGKFASLLITDKSGILRVVLWNDKTDLIESGKLKVGQVVRFCKAYTKEDRAGKVELHIGEKGEVEINPYDVQAKDYPTISKFATKIGELNADNKNRKVNIAGTVKRLFSASTFEREDSSSGKVMRFILADETGEISVVVWNEKVDALEKTLRNGLQLQIVNAKVKKALGEGSEVHVDSVTYVEAVESAEEMLRIADLKEGLSRVNVEGEIVTKPVLRNVKTSKEELLKVVSFELKDETGRIWVSAWRKHAEMTGTLKQGARVIIKHAYVKKGFGDQLEISTRDATTITAVS
jgi:replication factor A1